LLFLGCTPSSEDPASPERAAQLAPSDLVFAQNHVLQDGPTFTATVKPQEMVSVRARVPGSVRELLVAPGDTVISGQVIAYITPTPVYEGIQATKDALTELNAAAKLLQNLATQYESAWNATQRADLRERLRQANIRLEQARGRTATLERKQNFSTVYAPASGVVSQAFVAVEAAIGAGDRLYTIINPTTYTLEAVVPREPFAAVTVGMSATLTLPTEQPTGQLLQGIITSLEPAPDGKPTLLRLRGTFLNPRQQLITSTQVQGRILTQQRNTLAIPQRALYQIQTRPTVTRLRNGRVERVTVGTGIRDAASQMVEIRSGLTPSDSLIQGSLINLPSGTTVRLRTTD